MGSRKSVISVKQKYLVNGLIISTFVIILVMNGCSVNKTKDFIKLNDFNSSTKIYAYVETKVDTIPLDNPSIITDVLIVDSKTNTKNYVTQDIFLDEKPTWSPNGKYLAFLTARVGSEELLSIQGYGGTRQICIYDVLNKNKLYYPGPYLHGVVAVFWASDGKYLYYFDTQNRLFKLSLFDQTETFITKVTKIDRIHSVSYCPLNNILAFCYVNDFPFKYGIGILSIEKLNIEYLLESDQALILGGWSVDATSFLFTDSLLKSYNIASKITLSMNIPNKEFDIFVSEAQYLSKDTIVFLGSKKIPSPDSNLGSYSGNYEIYSFDLNNLKASKISNDGLEKSNLSVALRWKIR